MNSEHSFFSQVRRNAVALISLFIALSSLGYNTWRNEESESNRNVRTAAFEILATVGQLQEVVFLSHYDRDQKAGNPRRGWAYVLNLHDLSQAVSGSVSQAATDLQKDWSDHWQGLGSNDADAKEIDQAIDDLRQATLTALRTLD